MHSGELTGCTGISAGMKRYNDIMKNNEKGKKIGSGWTAQVFEAGEGRAVKLFAPWVQNAWVEHEYRSMRYAYENGLPVPRADELRNDGNRCSIIMERIQGHSMMRDTMFCQHSKLALYGRILADLQVRIHAVKAPAKIPAIHQKLEQRINSASELPSAVKEAALAILKDLSPGDVLCHFDLHVNNIIMSPSGPVVIDWTGAVQGPPEADVARTWFLCTLFPTARPLKALLYPRYAYFYEEYLKKYISLNPINISLVEQWKIPVLAARISEERKPARKKYLLEILEQRLKVVRS